MKLDILAFGAHPDDIELGCAGTLALQASKGYKCGIVDLTRGEMSTRGTPEIRDDEGQKAAEILGMKVRENLGFKDVFFINDVNHQMKVIKMIRKYQPEVVLANALTDRHPDHNRGAELVKTASFLAGLRKVKTKLNGETQQAHRPHLILHYIQFHNLKPDIIINISNHIQTKRGALKAHTSQFYNPDSKEPETLISSQHFLNNVICSSREMGRLIGVEHGEGFLSNQNMGTNDLMNLYSVR